MAVSTTRELGGDKAQRIIEAMRASVGERGVAGSPFDHVARAAGVSRGLLHYYFATKERLLVEVVRRDCDVRMALLDEAIAAAGSADELVAVLVSSLEEMVEQDPGFIAMLFELFTLARRNEEIATELAELLRRTRTHVAERLEAKQEEGVIRLEADAQAVAVVLCSLGDGLALRLLAEPGHDYTATMDAAVACCRSLLQGP